MKLLHCLKCKDTVALIQEWRFCVCGKSFGKYLNEIQMGLDKKATYSGPSVIIGLPNDELERVHEYTGNLTPPECVGRWVVISRSASTLELTSASQRRLLTAKPRSARLVGPRRAVLKRYGE